MRKITPLETKYLLRIITSTLRVGVSSMTIIDGLAIGFTGIKENRDIIEKAYNLHPDLGEISRILAIEGINKLKSIDINYGIPVQSMLASRIPYTEIIGKLGSPCIAEYKLDGERIQVHKQLDDIKLYSRRLIEISDQYPDVCQFIREKIHADNTIIEGEVVAMDSSYSKMLPFQVLSKRRRKYDIEDITKDVPVCLFLFDLLKLEKESYIDKALTVRREKLEEIVNEEKYLKLVKSVKIESTEQLLEFFNKARKDGTEGIIAKAIGEGSTYHAGNRGYLWIKMKGIEGAKLADTIDTVIIGGRYGRRGGVFGTYLVAVYDPERDVFEAFTRVSSGWTDEIIEKLMIEMKQYEINKKHPKVICDDEADKWFRPEVTIEITGDEITMSDKFSSLGFSLRFPVFLRFRPEKGPKDITTVSEIENLYDIQ
jgi:DNA ligase-1